METIRFYNTLAEAQEGDYAFVGNSMVVITKITPTRRMEVRGGKNHHWTMSFKSNGNQITSDKWHSADLEPYSEANFKAYSEYTSRRNALNYLQSKDWTKFSTEDLKEISKLVNSKDPLTKSE